MNRGAKFMMLRSTRQEGQMRNGNRWMPPYYEGMPQNDMDYGESRFRDRRGREHYDNGRFAPMRNAMDDDDMEDYAENNRMGRIVNFEPRQIGFNHMEGYGQSKTQHGGAHGAQKMDEQTAREWTKNMKNEDGTKGPHWTMEQVKQLMAQKGIQHDPVEFFAVLNAVYSDGCKVAKKHGVNTIDYYVDMAKAWLEDEDALPNKAMLYYECIVK